MPQIVPFLWFEKDAEAAARFYVSLLPNSRLDRVNPLPVDTPSGPAGSVQVVDFTLAGQPYQAINAGPLDPALGCASEEWRQSGTVRLAAGSLGPLLADRAARVFRDDAKLQSRRRQTCRNGNVEDGEAGHGRASVRVRRQLISPSSKKV